jgi:hypothetical protein
VDVVQNDKPVDVDARDTHADDYVLDNNHHH